MKKLPTLYKYDNKGNTRQWDIIVKGDSYWCEYGIIGKKITVTKPTYVQGKNIGRANETTAEEQAYKDALAKWQKNVDKEYTRDIDEVYRSYREYFVPQAANKWKDFKDRMPDGNEDLMISPKLDGVRATAKYELTAVGDALFFDDEYSVVMRSRNNKIWLACPHLVRQSKILLDELNKQLKTEELGRFVILDGEFYNHDLKDEFNKIISLTRKTKPTAQDLEDSEKMIQYHIFDICLLDESMHAADREKYLISAYEAVKDQCPDIIIVEQIHTSKSKAPEIFAHHIQQGYEGSMIRLASSPYEQKRTRTLLKYKEFFDNEFKIKEIIEGNGNRAGMMGKVIVEDSLGVLHPTSTGEPRTFKADSRGSHEYFTHIFNNPDEYIGKLATVRYQQISELDDDEGGVPRFGKMIAVRDYE